MIDTSKFEVCISYWLAKHGLIDVKNLCNTEKFDTGILEMIKDFSACESLTNAEKGGLLIDLFSFYI